MHAIYLLQFSMGIILVYVISSGCPPRKFIDRFVNFLCAVPGSVAATGAIVYQKQLDPFSSLLITSLLFCLILVTILRGMSREIYRKSPSHYPSEQTPADPS